MVNWTFWGFSTVGWIQQAIYDGTFGLWKWLNHLHSKINKLYHWRILFHQCWSLLWHLVLLLSFRFWVWKQLVIFPVCHESWWIGAFEYTNLVFVLLLCSNMLQTQESTWQRPESHCFIHEMLILIQREESVCLWYVFVSICVCVHLRKSNVSNKNLFC